LGKLLRLVKVHVRDAYARKRGGDRVTGAYEAGKAEGIVGRNIETTKSRV